MINLDQDQKQIRRKESNTHKGINIAYESWELAVNTLKAEYFY